MRGTSPCRVRRRRPFRSERRKSLSPCWSLSSSPRCSDNLKITRADQERCAPEHTGVSVCDFTQTIAAGMAETGGEVEERKSWVSTYQHNLSRRPGESDLRQKSDNSGRLLRGRFALLSQEGRLGNARLSWRSTQPYHCAAKGRYGALAKIIR